MNTLSLPWVLLHAWREDPGWGQGGARSGDNIHKSVLIEHFMISIGMSFSQSRL